MSADQIKDRLVGKHVTVHNLDFEVSEKDHSIKIFPHAEQIKEIKSLPITRVDLKNDGEKTKVVINSKMREIDSGGPTIVIFFCTCMLVGALCFYIFGKQEFSIFTYSLLAVGIVVFAIFLVRMQTGYYDYVRKIRRYVKDQALA
jgi:predicted cation transporter